MPEIEIGLGVINSRAVTHLSVNAFLREGLAVVCGMFFLLLSHRDIEQRAGQRANVLSCLLRRAYAFAKVKMIPKFRNSLPITAILPPPDNPCGAHKS